MELNQSAELVDALVVGGGPAGLSAAIYLARWCRSVAVVNCDRPGRSDWPQVNHNYLGFPEGITARELVERGRAQAEGYGARFHDAEVAYVSRPDEDGVFKAEAPGLTLRARAILLATGVRDRWVEFPGYEEFIGRTIHWCIVCDGYEMQGQRVVIAGNDEHTAEMAVQMLRFTQDVTVVTNAGSLGMPPALVKRLDQHRIRLAVGRIVGARAREEGALAALTIESGGETTEVAADHLFSVQGSEPNNALARSLGVRLSADGFVEAGTEGMTSVPGVFAAGDLTRLFSHQIVTAAHEGAAAANALNYYLFEKDEEAFRTARGQASTDAD
ncbi:MAG: Thioredoxin reductase [uncultured Thermomicrobiales bacterium]|uniref:Thioredoxin reductase n=1 Tax=uncultured Thermomicrobiales bacterium TaxID=1645740 RepID=A0A6J4VHW5_9BACT|nr:MAG: Thioredoxin reductase [uncultured Thermomicrobiales bacterium]